MCLFCCNIDLSLVITATSHILFLVQAGSQEAIVSPIDIHEGGSFTVTCEASRAGVPDEINTIRELEIAYAENDNSLISYAVYDGFDSTCKMPVRVLF